MLKVLIFGDSFNLIFKQFDPVKKHIENLDVPFTVSCVQFTEYFFLVTISYVILIMTYLKPYRQ